MSQIEVFRPSDGPLILRGNLANGLPEPMDVFRKQGGPGGRLPSRQGSRQGSRHSTPRPATQGSSRFGVLSHHSFFARHNPHPGRVRHIKGLLDIPICSVNDDGFVSNPRYSLQFPPNNFDASRLKNSQNVGSLQTSQNVGSLQTSQNVGSLQTSQNVGSLPTLQNVGSLPVATINVNSQLHPINTITGLQKFLGMPMNYRVFREKAVPTIGMVPVTDVWRDELRALTEAAGLGAAPPLPAGQEGGSTLPPGPWAPGPGSRAGTQTPRTADPHLGSRPRTMTRYSEETGRLIPPPSRAMSRQASRQASRSGGPLTGRLDPLAQAPDEEDMIMQMLCQILQTDDVTSVQSWLVMAADREKALMLDMIRVALSNRDAYYNHAAGADLLTHPPAPRALPPGAVAGFDPNLVPGTPLGAEDDIAKQIDRLCLDKVLARPTHQQGEESRFMRHSYTPPSGDSQQAECFLPAMEPAIPEEGIADCQRPVTSEVFRPNHSRSSARPRSGLARPKTPSKPQSPIDLSSEAKLRYTRTPIQDQDIESQRKGLTDILQD